MADHKRPRVGQPRDDSALVPDDPIRGLTPSVSGLRFPAEWALHEACWLAWPYQADWGPSLDLARREIVELARAIADVDARTGRVRGEALRVLVRDERQAAEASVALGRLSPEIVPIPFGDVWMRDTLPLFLVKDSEAEGGDLAAACFAFNGWGGKYCYPEDDGLAARIADHAGAACFHSSMVLEGGAVDVDGEGTVLTTRQCLLNANRNPRLGLGAVEDTLRSMLGAQHVVWIERGLLNDHTDGHVDTIARFVRPGVVVCMTPREPSDPNAEVLLEIERTLERSRDTRGRRLEVVRLPSPGAVVDGEGRLMPASYTNFYIANTTVVVPTYGTAWDDEAVAMIGELFPERRVVGLSAKAVLTGGGAFHCITQQQPRVSGGRP